MSFRLGEVGLPQSSEDEDDEDGDGVGAVSVRFMNVFLLVGDRADEGVRAVGVEGVRDGPESAAIWSESFGRCRECRLVGAKEGEGCAASNIVVY